MLRHMAVITALLVCTVIGSAQAGFNRGKLVQQYSDLQFFTVLTGAQEVTNPPGGVETGKIAVGFVTFDAGFTKLRVRVRLNDSSDVVAAHFHCGMAGQNGPVVFGLFAPGPLMPEDNMIHGNLSNADATGADCMPVIGRPVTNVASLAYAMNEGLIYLNIHTSAYPGGEIRGQLQIEHS